MTFVVVDQIREWLTSGDGWEERSKCGWTMTDRERCLQLAAELLSKDGWKEETIRDLASPDNGAFYWANKATRKMGIETWDRLFARVEADPIKSNSWYDLTEATDATRILVAFAERVLPLEAIASGPADEMGLGTGFEPHGTLDWMLQLLDRFPGRGWPLIRAGLQSPVVRNRNWPLRVFKNWLHQDWPPDARQVLQVAAMAEPDDDRKEN